MRVSSDTWFASAVALLAVIFTFVVTGTHDDRDRLDRVHAATVTLQESLTDLANICSDIESAKPGPGDLKPIIVEHDVDLDPWRVMQADDSFQRSATQDQHGRFLLMYRQLQVFDEELESTRGWMGTLIFQANDKAGFTDALYGRLTGDCTQIEPDRRAAANELDVFAKSITAQADDARQKFRYEFAGLIGFVVLMFVGAVGSRH